MRPLDGAASEAQYVSSGGLVLAGGVILLTYVILPFIGIASLTLDALPSSLPRSVKISIAIAFTAGFVLFVLARQG